MYLELLNFGIILRKSIVHVDRRTIRRSRLRRATTVPGRRPPRPSVLRQTLHLLLRAGELGLQEQHLLPVTQQRSRRDLKPDENGLRSIQLTGRN
jgi:hypothetical protein